MKKLLAISLALISVGCVAQPWDGRDRNWEDRPHRYEHRAPRQHSYGGPPHIIPEVTHRYVERADGTRVRVTKTRTCTRSDFDRHGRPICLNWDVDVRKDIRR